MAWVTIIFLGAFMISTALFSQAAVMPQDAFEDFKVHLRRHAIQGGNLVQAVFADNLRVQSCFAEALKHDKEPLIKLSIDKDVSGTGAWTSSALQRVRAVGEEAINTNKYPILILDAHNGLAGMDYMKLKVLLTALDRGKAYMQDTDGNTVNLDDWVIIVMLDGKSAVEAIGGEVKSGEDLVRKGAAAVWATGSRLALPPLLNRLTTIPPFMLTKCITSDDIYEQQDEQAAEKHTTEGGLPANVCSSLNGNCLPVTTQENNTTNAATKHQYAQMYAYIMAVICLICTIMCVRVCYPRANGVDFAAVAIQHIECVTTRENETFVVCAIPIGSFPEHVHKELEQHLRGLADSSSESDCEYHADSEHLRDSISGEHEYSYNNSDNSKHPYSSTATNFLHVNSYEGSGMTARPSRSAEQLVGSPFPQAGRSRKHSLSARTK